MRPTTADPRFVSVRSFLLGASLLLTAAACGPATVPVQSDLAPEPEAAAPTARAPRPRAARSSSLRDPITAADIAGITASSAYDAVVKLRANFLRDRGINSFMTPVRSTRPVVFVDGIEMGTIHELRSIPARDVAEIRFLSSSEAMFRFGDGYLAGVIHVTTKR
jgi:hypothetical protein